MDPIVIAALTIVGMFILIVLHVPIGLAMATAGVIAFGFMSSFKASFSLLATEMITTISGVDMSVVPLFLLMGNFANAAGISTDLYSLAYALVGRWRGGLAMSTIGACGLFGAVCGSSFATVATFGRIALPQMLARGYAPTLATGCVAAGATLASLVPPSIVMVIYAIMAEQYIIDIFVAAIIPSAIAILFHAVAIAIYVRIYPLAGPAGDSVGAAGILHTAIKAWGSIFLLVAIAAGIYGGVFTVTEAAALGAILAFLLAIFRGRMNLTTFWQSLTDTATNSAMIYMIIVGAYVLNYFIVLTHLPDYLATGILDSGWSTFVILTLLLCVYIFLGCVFDTIASMIITLPFVLPIIEGMGYSPVWWGIINVVVIEIGLITPPIGINVFVLQGVAKEFQLSTIFKGTMPFLFADTVRLVILIIFPGLCLWLLKVFA